jgi:hypothetical protein
MQINITTKQQATIHFTLSTLSKMADHPDNQNVSAAYFVPRMVETLTRIRQANYNFNTQQGLMEWQTDVAMLLNLPNHIELWSEEEKRLLWTHQMMEEAGICWMVLNAGTPGSSLDNDLTQMALFGIFVDQGQEFFQSQDQGFHQEISDTVECPVEYSLRSTL